MSSKGNILILDDDKIVRETLMRDLSHLGYSCDDASDGDVTLKKLFEGKIDVALIDRFNSNINGIEVLEAIREAHVDTVPIILTSQKKFLNSDEAIKFGVFDYLEKPAGSEMVHRSIERALKHRDVMCRAHEMADIVHRWEAAFDATPDMIVVLASDHRILAVNRAFAKRLGCTKDVLIGRNAHEALCTKFNQEAWGGDFEIMACPLAYPYQNMWASMRIVREITNHKRSEKYARKPSRKNGRIPDSTTSILIALDTRGKVTQWNTAAEAVFGITPTDAIGRPIAALMKKMTDA
ncbi:MAG: PAS domain S-box protein [Planctomycetota bacterium]|jgi:ActR/RegA family two-component response regulator